MEGIYGEKVYSETTQYSQAKLWLLSEIQNLTPRGIHDMGA